jgi:uncharacterized membrane protein
MNALLVTLRLVHIAGGVLWVGFGVFMALILGPALDRMGPDGGKVMQAIGSKLHTTIMPLVAVLTLVSGFWLFWIVSGGFSPAYVHSRTGITFALGGVAALSAFLIGLILIKPAMTKAMLLSQSLAAAPADRHAAIAAEAKRSRDRAIRVGKVATTLLVLATLCMAVARYL